MGVHDAPGMHPVGESDSGPASGMRASEWPTIATWLIDVGVVGACLLAANVGTALAVAAGAPEVLPFIGIPTVLMLAVGAVVWQRRTGRVSIGQRIAGLRRSAGPHPARATVGAIVALAAMSLWFVDMGMGLTWRRHWIPSAASLPTLRVRDVILVNRLHYRLQPIRSGDTVVFRAPPYVDREQRMFIKRVVGVAGDEIEVRLGQLHRNGRPIRERGWPDISPDPSATYEPYEIAANSSYEWGACTVPPGHVFVFGDNRDNSNDSRRWRRLTADGSRREAPELPVDRIQGKVVWRICPPDRIGVVH